MKKILSVLALILCFAFLPVQMIEAHPGRTDANGKVLVGFVSKSVAY